MSRPIPPRPNKPNQQNQIHDSIINGLKQHYKASILPLEAQTKFDSFTSPHLTDSDFEALPMVLLIGQYSTGKTTFIQYLLERDFQGMRIGPEPTTDRFTAIMYNNDERIIPGNALAVMTDKPFQGTQKFGMGFLNRFEGVQCNSPILQKFTLIDTPGVLSGEKQRVGRSYNFSEVVSWFAERADRIILLFDAHKLDISDELKDAMNAIAPHEEKVRCILNKSDGITQQHLMRVYGALMWSLGRVFKTPEVVRVYIGSFWNQPLKNNIDLIKAEEAELLADLRGLLRNSAVRKVNELIKRTKKLKVHLCIMNHLREQIGWFGKEKTQRKLQEGLLEQFKEVQKKYNLVVADFPHLGQFREVLKELNLDKIPKIEQKQIDLLDQIISTDIPLLMAKINSLEDPSNQPIIMKNSNVNNNNLQSPSFNNQYQNDMYVNNNNNNNPYNEDINQINNNVQALNPFAEDDDAKSPGNVWSIDQAVRESYMEQFFQLRIQSGKLSGSNAKEILLKQGLSGSDLKKIWDLSDIDKDGYLDCDEYIVAMYLIDQKKRSPHIPVPDYLEDSLVPPSKRIVGNPF